MRKRFKHQEGLVTLIFILLMALIATLLMVVGTSRVLLSLQRGKSSGDTLIASYQAESEINDVLLKLRKGLYTNADFSRFPIKKSLENGQFTIEIDGKIEGNNQIITATAKRFFAVSKIQAVRSTQQAQQVQPVDLVLVLDCTTSMQDPAGPGSSTTRMQEQTKAAASFVNSILNHPNGDFISLGLVGFGKNANWIRTSDNQQILPGRVSTQNILKVFQDDPSTPQNEQQFFSTRQNSPGCTQNGIQDFTSIGSGYLFAQEYLATHKTPGRQQVQILISDGEPNARIEHSQCSPSTDCQNCESRGREFLQCVITPNTTNWNTFEKGLRDPSVITYGITVLDPVNAATEDIFVTAIGRGNYYNAKNATQLSPILEEIFNEVISSVAKTTINRVIPIESQ